MKMRIKILQPVMLAGKMILSGKLVEIGQNHANELIARGIAEPVIEKSDAPAK